MLPPPPPPPRLSSRPGAVLSICIDGLYPGHRTQRRQQQQRQREQQKRKRRSQGRAGRRQGGGVAGEDARVEEEEPDEEAEEEGEEGPLTLAALARHAMCAPRQLIQLRQEVRVRQGPCVGGRRRPHGAAWS